MEIAGAVVVACESYMELGEVQLGSGRLLSVLERLWDCCLQEYRGSVVIASCESFSADLLQLTMIESPSETSIAGHSAAALRQV